MDVLGHEVQAECACDVGNEEDENEETTLVLKFVVQVDAEENGANDEGAIWYLHQSCDERREAEALDDKRSEIRDATIGYVADDTQEEEEVELDIRESFQHLVGLQMLILDPRLIRLEAFHSNAPLLVVEKLGCHRRVRHEDTNDDAPGAAE